MEELERLAALRDKGLLTEDEFDAKKREIIAATSPVEVRVSYVRKEPIPEGVRGWSWGPCLLSIIWSIGNKTWIGLLTLIPVLGWVMPIVLGFKGREWAWENNSWDSLEHFNRVQKKWSRWGAAIWLTPIVAAGACGLVSGVAQHNLERVRLEQRAKTDSMLGTQVRAETTGQAQRNGGSAVDVETGLGPGGAEPSSRGMELVELGNYSEDLKRAEQVYASGDKDRAKELYSRVAKEGSPEAHFAIAYKYNLPPEETIYHFSEAAKRGHEKALGYAIDALFFRADSLERANPQQALDLYEQAKKASPGIKLYDEEVQLQTLRMSVEPGPFDWKAFCEKYGLSPHNDEVIYHVWQIAEEASRGGRFGKPDPKLVFQLVSRGGWAPAELVDAVKEFHRNWKSGTVKEFNICDHVTSRGGTGFCSSRDE